MNVVPDDNGLKLIDVQCLATISWFKLPLLQKIQAITLPRYREITGEQTASSELLNAI